MRGTRLRLISWASIGAFAAAFVLIVMSTNAGNPNTVEYPTWDFSTSKQIVLVVVSGSLAVASMVLLIVRLALSATTRRPRGD